MRIPARTRVLTVLVFACFACAHASTPHASKVVNSDIRMHAIDAELTLLLSAVAASAGLEPRFGESVIDRDDTVSEIVTGNGNEALMTLASRFSLAVYISDGVAWIDDANDSHSVTLEYAPDVAQEVYQQLSKGGAGDNGTLQHSTGQLDIVGSRAFVALTSEQADHLMTQILAEQAIVETLAIADENPPVSPVAPEPEPRQEPTNTRSASTESSGPGTRTIRSISDVPGFDTEYAN